MQFLKIYTGIFLLLAFSAVSQSTLNSFLKPADTLSLQRRNTVVITESALAGTSLLALNQLWYQSYEQSSFHTTNDSGEWLQMDKLGHVYSAYQLGRIGAEVLQWSGVSKKSQLWYGATLGFSYLTVIEIFDGFSKEWGFSWTDMLANATGASLYIGQELLWKEQRVVLKYSFHQTAYASQNPEKLGNGFLEEMLKDYNGQTYWLSANVHSFFKSCKFPKWLNVALGYSGKGMLTGSKTEAVDNFIITPHRKRQLFLSLDVDLTKIETNSHVLKTIFSVFNVIKVPFPAVEFTDKNDIKLHGIYF
ncbi:MAG TPA: DUF2279 domain-containing protein [Flavobacteriaceae bacterium]|nr:DUF2279 domain-containing protein [Flavobacteriaceae bacterium]